MPGLIRRAADPLAERGVLCCELAEFEHAAECFERAAGRARGARPERARLLGRACAAREDLALANAHADDHRRVEPELARVLALDPGRGPALLLRARLLERSGRVRAALRDLASLEGTGHRSISGSLLAACCHATLGDREATAEAFGRAAGLWAQQPCLVFTEIPSQVPPARPALVDRLRRVVALRPSSAAGRIGLAELLLDGGGSPEAELHLDAARLAGPADVRVAILRARARLEIGAATEAVRFLEELSGARAALADVCGWLGVARYHAGDLVGACAALDRALARNRRYAAAWRARALVCFAAGDDIGALRSARQALVRHRERPEVGAAALECLADAPEDADLAVLRRATRMQPDYPDLRGHLDRALRALSIRPERAEGVRRESWDGGRARPS